jgi:DNA repair exonuclease SbcCD ATPase subunit
MDVIARNFVGVSRANIHGLTKTALVAGHNGAGKSSLLAGVAAVLCQTPTVRGATKKNEAGKLVTSGAERAQVRIVTDNGEATMTWPSCELHTEGSHPPEGHPLAVGLRHLTELDRKERSNQMVDLLGAEPSYEDLQQALAEAGITAEKHVTALWERIQSDGWTATQTWVQQRASTLKGQWKETTGEAWGSAKAENWQPREGWSEELRKATEAQLDREVQQAQEKLEQAIANAAVSEEHLEKLRNEAEDYDDANEEAKRLEKEKADVDQELEQLYNKRKEMRDPEAAAVPCPHCQQPIRIQHSPNRDGSAVIEKADVEYDKDELKRIRTEIAKTDGRIDNLRKQSGDLTREQQHVHNRLTRAKQAYEELEKLQERTGRQQAVDKAREAYEQAKQRRSAWKAWTRAHSLHKGIKGNLAIQEIVKPEGLRQKKLSKRLEEFNDKIADYAKRWGVKRVAIEHDMAVTYGERMYASLSRGEQLRVKAVLQVAFADLTQTPLIVIDDLDSITPQDRPGLFEMLAYAQQPALVAMLNKSSETVPGLAKAGLGTSYWIENGELQEIG